MFVWNADPIALTLGPLELRWYGLLFSGGFIIGYFIMTYMFRQKHYKTEDLDKLLLLIFLGTVIGARLGHCLIYEPDFYLAHPLEILKIWHGGLASHGGTLGVLIAVFFYARRSPYSLLELLDMLSVPVALVSCMIRLGNFMNSEILGIQTDSPFGVIFARLGENFARYPVQLFEAMAYFAIFILLVIVYFKLRPQTTGIIFCLLIFLVFGARFLLEPLKVEQADYATGISLSVGQLLSIPFILGSAALGIYLLHQNSSKGK